MLLTINLVWGLDLCEDTVIISSNCTMVTPLINCVNYTYEIYNSTKKMVETGNLTEWNGSVYYINFTLGEGDYLIKLCDGTTREVEVEHGDEDNMWLAIVISLCLMTFLMFVASAIIKNKELQPIKGLFFMLGVVHTLILGTLPFFIALNPYNSASFLPIALGYLSVNIITIILFIYLKGMGLIINIFKFMRSDQKDD